MSVDKRVSDTIDKMYVGDHEATLPDDLKFTDEMEIRFEVDGVLILPSVLIYGLITAVVVSPANRDERHRKTRKVYDREGGAHFLTSLCFRRLPLLAKQKYFPNKEVVGKWQMPFDRSRYKPKESDLTGSGNEQVGIPDRPAMFIGKFGMCIKIQSSVDGLNAAALGVVERQGRAFWLGRTNFTQSRFRSDFFDSG